MPWDRELEKRVWQRVRGTAGSFDLAPLIRVSQWQATDLSYLNKELSRQQQLILSMLQGLHQLCGGQEIRTVPQHPCSQRERFLRCRRRCGEILSMLVALENHPRYGTVFTDLTRIQRAICAQLQAVK